MGVEPTQGSFEPHAGFEDQEHHRAPVTSASGLQDFLVKHHNRRADEQGPSALVQLSEPVNRFPDFVRYLVRRSRSRGRRR